MADLILSDGQEITFDLNKITIKEYREIFDPTETNEDSDRKLAKVCGMELDEVLSISYLDYRQLVNAFFRKCKEPLAVPN